MTMECNKEEAVRAREIAEKKFAEKDINGAMRFALKAQNLFPALDGIQQFIETLNVYVSAQRRVNGEIDWYRVLGVEPSYDYETLRNRYRRLALTLHPDKNKSVGADGAFRLLSEAWNLLSDRSRRAAYDQSQIQGSVDNNVPNWKPPAPTTQNGFPNFYNYNHSTSRVLNSSMHPRPVPPSFSEPNTFWTICSTCKTHFEYLRNYLGNHLLCQNCHQPFLAVETPPPHMNGTVPPRMWPPYTQGLSSTQNTNVENLHGVSLAEQVEALKRKREEGPTIAARVDPFPRQTKRGAVLALAASGAGFVSELKGDKLKKKRHGDGHRPGEFLSPKCSVEVGRGNLLGNPKPDSTRELSPLELRALLTGKARKDICEKLREWSSVASASKSLEKQMEIEEQRMLNGAVNDSKAYKNGYPESAHVKKTKAISIQSSPLKSSDIPVLEVNGSLSMSVPDPDFHDFDKDRSEKSFADNQVWAAYDDDDGMPRYYALIHSVISLKPFKVRISWLNSKSNNEFGPLNWIGAGFYKTAGEFWIGKREINTSINSFSHKIGNWSKGIRGAVHIYPAKGDVWALYRNWSHDWNELTPNDVIHKYDMVEILEDYTKERGVIVAPLVKVAGFKTVFCRNSDPGKAKIIPREEMFQFSHQVPSFMLTGEEGANAPKGCWELDPASTPMELLQVLTESQLEEKENAENTKEKDSSVDIKIPKEEQLVETGVMTKGKGVMGDATRKDAANDDNTKLKEIKKDKLLVYHRRHKKN